MYNDEPDDSLTRFTHRRAAEIGGITLCLVAGYFFLALSTFSKADPSWNMSADRPVSNWGGSLGAYIADLSLQFIGLASILLILLPCAWGVRLLQRRRISLWPFRFSTLFVTLPFCAALLAAVEAPDFWPFSDGLGGAIGTIVYGKMAHIFTPAATLFVCVIGFIAAGWFTFGLKLHEWVSLFIFALHGMRKLFGLLLFRRVPVSDEDDEQDERNLIERVRDRFHRDADQKEEDEEEQHYSEKRRRVKRLQSNEDEEPQRSLALKPARGRKSVYKFPPLNLLSQPSGRSKKHTLSESALEQNARLLETVLQDFGVNGEITGIRPGPVVTLYELEPAAGTKSSRVIGLSDDIARSMSAISTRIAVIPGRNAIGIELPNTTRETVLLRELLEDDAFGGTEMKLPLALGKDIGGAPMVVDLAKMPHLLVAGTTGSGKSVAINTMILSLLYHLPPDQCKFIMIDPKMLELSGYDNIPHLLSPVVTEPGKAVVALKWTVREMENRYRLMSNLGVRNIDGYNKRIAEAVKNEEVLMRSVQTGFDPDTGKPIIEEMPLEMTPLPFIVVIVDEMADLMLVAGKEIEGSIQRLAQMARAAGIHIIMATQRPSVDVITGVIKANFPTRMSFQVTSKIDSRTILGEQGAEQLLGQGDMLYMAGGGRITRIHGPFVSDKEVESVVAHARAQGEPSYIEDITRDEEEEAALLGEVDEGDEDSALYQQAVAIVMRDRKASTSYIQRCLKIGYNRSARLIDRMEQEGIVGPANHVGKREVIR